MNLEETQFSPKEIRGRWLFHCTDSLVPSSFDKFSLLAMTSQVSCCPVGGEGALVKGTIKNICLWKGGRRGIRLPA